MKSSLAEVLQYSNENVVSRFAEDYGISENDAEEIFLEMKRWLWICAKRKNLLEQGHAEFFQVPLFNEANVIDMMWHTFLLYTEDYANFCDTYFGFFVHHQPRSKAERKAWQQRIHSDPDSAWSERRESLRKVYDYLYEELGEETLVKWCEVFPEKFKVLA